MIAVSNGMYVYIIFSFEACFVLKVWLHFIYNREKREAFLGVKRVKVLVFTWFVGILEVEQEQSKIYGV